MILCGGVAQGPPGGVLNDVWELTLGGSPAWHPIVPTNGSIPGSPWEAVYVIDPERQRLLVYGGVNAPADALLHDTWQLSLGLPKTWTQLSTTAGNPLAQNPEGFYDPHRHGMIVTGGYRNDEVSCPSDVWLFPFPSLADVPPGSSPAGSLALVVAPNPFGSLTGVQFVLERGADVDVAIFDLAGRKVRQLLRGYRGTGIVRVEWNGLDDHGQRAAGGVFLVRVRLGGETVSKRIVLLR